MVANAEPVTCFSLIISSHGLFHSHFVGMSNFTCQFFYGHVFPRTPDEFILEMDVLHFLKSYLFHHSSSGNVASLKDNKKLAQETLNAEDREKNVWDLMCN